MTGRVRYNSLSENEKKKHLGEFYTMISMMSTRDEVKIFLKDILSLSEITMISRRLQIAKMLLAGNTYAEVKDKLGSGNSTIASVDRWLNEGFGGYKTVLKKYNKASKKQMEKKIEDDVSDISFKNLKKKYPGHFLLLKLLDK